MSDIKDKIEEKLKAGGSLDADYLASLNNDVAEAAIEEAKGEETAKKTTVELNDPQLEAASQAPNSSEMIQETDVVAVLSGKKIEFNAEEELTDGDKESFLDSIITGSRFKRTHRIFSGKLTCEFQSRSSQESDCITFEARRRSLSNEFPTMVDYTSFMKRAMLFFQVVSVNGTDLDNKFEGGLRAKEVVGKVIPPDWVTKAEDYYGSKSDAYIESLYAELTKFEAVYAYMIQRSDDQNFWNPEESTSA